MTNLADKPAISVSLASLILAPENARFHVSTDDDSDIPDMANSLAADSSGQILPMFVRDALIGEPAGVYVLDGRRRLAAFNMLLAQGRIDAEHPVAAILCETEAEIMAASVITNSQRSEQLSQADMLIAINRQTAAGRSLDTIARILCVDVKEVARQSKLGGLDIRFLQGFKTNKVQLSTLKRLSAITDVDAVNALAQQLQAHGYLYNHHLDRYLAARESIESPVFGYVAVDEYRAKGGRVEEDLFETVGDAILDPKVLYDLFEGKFKKTLKPMRSAGVEVVFLAELKGDLTLPDRIELPYTHDSVASELDLERVDEKIEAAMIASAEAIEAGDAAEAVSKAGEVLKLRFDRAKLEVAPMELSAVHFGLNDEGQFEHVAFIRETDYAAYQAELEAARNRDEGDQSASGEGEDGDRTGTDEASGVTASPTPAPIIKKPADDIEVETEGLSAAVHNRLSIMAGMGLARTLSTDPMVALDITVSTLLAQAGDYFHTSLDNFVVQLRVGTSIPRNGDPVFLKPIADPLKSVVQAWSDSGKHVFTFVQELPMHEKLEVLALIVALQVSTSEFSTGNIRKKARLEAALLTEALGHDMSSFWTGDVGFYSQFTKSQLFDFLRQMETDPDDFAGVKKDRLVREVTELAAERRFVPPHLKFRRTAEAEPVLEEVDAAETISEAEVEPPLVGDPAGEAQLEDLAA